MEGLHAFMHESRASGAAVLARCQVPDSAIVVDTYLLLYASGLGTWIGIVSAHPFAEQSPIRRVTHGLYRVKLLRGIKYVETGSLCDV